METFLRNPYLKWYTFILDKSNKFLVLEIFFSSF